MNDKRPITSRERELAEAIGRAQAQLEQRVDDSRAAASAWRTLEDALIVFSAEVPLCSVCGDYLEGNGSCPDAECERASVAALIHGGALHLACEKRE